jgi:UDP-N-acetylmuramate dehydrogenase
MRFEEHKSLKEFNTFGIESTARYFVSVHTVSELKQALASTHHPKKFILGGGSNMLLTENIDALVIHIALKGIAVEPVGQNQVLVTAQAGENWHEFVRYCIDHGYGGLENLSLIPGNVGTAPIQNIGAYGVELKDTFVSCRAIHIATLEEREFSKEECQFGYRDSIFKNEAKGAYVITSVQFLLKSKDHILNTGYGAIQAELEKRQKTNPTIADVSEAVIAIRQSKLPDPKKLGNSGSFFKNPVLNASEFQEFRSQFPEAPFYEVSASEFKIPAGWLIEKAGFKGYREGDAGVHKNQALVLVNHGNATGPELWNLALKIQRTVQDIFGIYIEPEVNVL